MRFRRLDLLAYGKFTDVSLDFTDGLPDLHLIYGPNEAGKSTLRSGVADFLYGIPGQTTLNFQHDYKRMRLGAAVEGGGRVLELTRRKGNKGTLRDIADEPAPDSLLEDLLGGDRAFYERMFALSHERLRAGGEEILQGKDDAAETLFAAAAGLSGLHEVRQKLEEEAKALWTPRKLASAYQIQFKALKQAAADRDNATAQAKDWQAAADALTAAISAYESAKNTQSGFDGRRARLERVRRVAPHLRARSQALRERAALGEVRLLPPNAADTLAAFRQDRAVILDRQERLKPQIKELEQKIGELQPDAVVLHRAAEIDALVDEKKSLSRHPRDLDRRRTEARSLEAEVLRIARRLGWAEAADQALESRIPSPLKRGELRGLLERREGFEARADIARGGLESRHAELQEATSEADRLNAEPVSPEWQAALESAGGLRDFADQRANLARALAAAEADWQRALPALLPWQGEAEQLRLHPPVSADRARDWLKERRESEAELQRLADRERENDEKLEAKRLELQQLVRNSDPITVEQLQAVRQTRDELWSRIASGAVALSETASAYEGAVLDADALADRRFEGAEAVGRWTALTDEIEVMEQQAGAIGAKRRGAEDRLASLRESWRAEAARLGDADFALDDYSLWLAARDRALDKATAVDHARTALAAFDRRVDQAVAALRQAWARHSGLPVTDEPDDLGAWLIRTERAQKSRSEAVTLRARLQHRIEILRVAVQRDEQAAARTGKELSDWRERYQAALAEVGLPATTSPEAAGSSLEVFEELDRKLDELRGSRERIGKMEADLNAFALQVRDLAQKLAPEWAELPPDKVAEELASRLEQARQDEAERERQKEALLGKHEEADAAQLELAEAEASIRPLLEDAGAADLDALHAAVERSDEARKLDARIEEKTAEALQAGSPLDLAALEAEMDAEDGNDLEAELSTIKTELENVQQSLQEAVERRKDAEHLLAGFGAGAAAAQAEARRQEALAEMIDISGRWVRATVGHKLLGWAIQRYRESHQGPLLQRAGELFRLLTVGSFERLTVEDDDDKAAIFALRSGDLIGVDAMSDGTRDQLYLALRVAALELHLDKGAPLPFLADDLFVNWDNERAKAGLRLLADLAGRTQVLFLTHHEHLLDLAREAVGADCSIVPLPA